MKKIIFSAAILAFAGITAFSASSHPAYLASKSVVMQDTTKSDTTQSSSTDTTSTSKPDTTSTSK